MDKPTRSASHPAPVTPVKGSWEDLLYRGKQLVATQNQEGGAILQNVIDRLARMPAASLSAGNHRLSRILVDAINSVSPYLLTNQRYDEALANIELAERIEMSTEPEAWRIFRAMVLIQSGAVDDGFALLREVVQEQGPELWQVYVIEAIQRQRIDLAEEGIKEAEHAINRVSATTADADTVRQLRAALAYAKAQTAAANNKPSEASAWMEYTLVEQEAYTENLASFYLRLVDREQFTEALKWARRDQTRPVRSKFWQGYTHHHLGKSEEAKLLWRQVVKTNIADEEHIDVLEYVLAHYFLGDQEGIGLGLTLELMERSNSISAIQFFMGGLGWAMRGDASSAHTNFQQSLRQLRGLAMGHKLQPLWWRLCTDLVAEDVLPQYAKYFDLPETHSL